MTFLLKCVCKSVQMYLIRDVFTGIPFGYKIVKADSYSPQMHLKGCDTTNAMP